MSFALDPSRAAQERRMSPDVKQGAMSKLHALLPRANGTVPVTNVDFLKPLC